MGTQTTQTTQTTQIATLVERNSRFTNLIKFPSRDLAEVADTLGRQIVKLPAHPRRSLTWDRGLVMTRHPDFSVAIGVQVCIYDPRSSRKRGTNENTNRLVRQYFPKVNPSMATVGCSSMPSLVNTTCDLARS